MVVAILAEKPSQAKAYSEAYQVEKRDKTSITLKTCNTFPEGAIITWGIGHLVSLKMPNEYKEEWAKWDLKNLPIIPDEFQFKVVSDKKTQFAFIKKLFNDPAVSSIVNACDVDAEGSNIFYSIFNMSGSRNKVIKRLWINSLEIEEVRKGFENLQDNKKDLLLYERAKARQIADWLVGINASQLFTLLLNQKGLNTTLSIGRVQSPTVYLIYQRQQEIDKFVPKPFYEIEANFTADNGAYKGKAKIKSDKKDEVQGILDQHKIAGQNAGFVKSVTKKEKRKKSPKLHALSTLQATANKKWKYSPAEVLKLMQGLYEKKIVTYPRTDTQFITDNEFAYLWDNVEAYQKVAGASFEVISKEPNKRFVDGSKVAEHYAIVPTKNIPSESTLQGLSKEERNIYFEILNTTLAMFHADYVYEETKIITDVNGLEFETTGNTEKSKGWQELFADIEKNDDDSKNEATQSLPVLKNEEKVLSVVKMKDGVTTPPKPYTEGQLIGMMKTCGKSVENEEDMEILKEVEGLGTEATRSGIIETIKKNGYIEVKKNIVSVTDKGIILCEAIEGNLLSSPSMTAKWESYLKKIGEGKGSQETFIEGINKFIVSTIDEAPKKIKSHKIQTAVIEQQKAQFIGVCPVCKKGKMADRKTFFGCSEYKSGCSFSISKSISGKKLTEKNVKDLLEKGETVKLKGFKSKGGKSFESKLSVKDGKVQFQFN